MDKGDKSQYGSVLLLGDNAQFCRALRNQITSHWEFGSVEIFGGSGTSRSDLKEDLDAIIVDVTQQRVTDHSWYNWFHDNYQGTSIIVLVEKSEQSFREIEATCLGSVQYITKPFRLGLFLAHLESILARRFSNKTGVISIGQYGFDQNRNLFFDSCGSNIIRLTDKETAILAFLCLYQDQVVSRTTLLREVWGYRDNIKTHTLETHIYRLRKKLRELPKTANILVTTDGGYRLCR